jgi:limonene-1,2-epoxide hydrolase
VTIKNIFATQDGSRLALEWDWTVTRRADGTRGTTPDAIIAELIDGKIKSWREYFDLSASVEGTG